MHMSIYLNIYSLPFYVQIIGLHGGHRPRKVSSSKSGHISITVTAPAEGPMMPILRAFSAKLNQKSVCEGTSNARWIKASNWWPDDQTVLIRPVWSRGHDRQRGFHKMLMFVGQIRALEHAAVAVRKNRVRLWRRRGGRRPRLPAWRQRSSPWLLRRRSASRSTCAPGSRSRTRTQKGTK